MEIAFYLKRPKSKTETAIWARISYNANQLKYYLPEKIHPKNWNKETHKAKESQSFKTYPEFNTRLKNIKYDIENVYRKFLNDNKGEDPLVEEFKNLLDRSIKKIGTGNNSSFFVFFKNLIDQSENGTRLYKGKQLAPGSIKVYRTTQKHLKSFQNTYKRIINFDTIDLQFYDDYTKYLTRELQLSTNTIGKHIRTIKLILNAATERGVNKNLAYKSSNFASLKENSDSIYLNYQELKEIEQLDLSKNESQDRIRDLFLIGCYTGLRFSDFSVLRPENIQDGFIKITQIKTGDPVIIPIHPFVKKILIKYHGQLPRSISNQKTNEILKQIGKLILSLQVPITKTITKGGIKRIRNCKKWELLTTHAGRRTFATNEYLAGTPTLTIMAITGHKSESSFRSYIKVTSNEHAILLKERWEKRESNKLIAI